MEIIAPLAPGFRPIRWRDVGPGDMVFVRGRHVGTPHAYGPYKVVRRHKLLNEGVNSEFVEYQETLCLPEQK